jgi:hypothetical protein
VCGGSALDLFEPDELELLICGNPSLELQELRNGGSLIHLCTAASMSFQSSLRCNSKYIMLQERVMTMVTTRIQKSFACSGR